MWKTGGQPEQWGAKKRRVRSKKTKKGSGGGEQKTLLLVKKHLRGKRPQDTIAKVKEEKVQAGWGTKTRGGGGGSEGGVSDHSDKREGGQK